MGHYHHARIEAFARRASMRVTVIELCDTSEFREFKLGAVQDPNYETVTLYRDRHFSEISPTASCRAIGSALDDLKPDLLLVQGWSDTYALAPLCWAAHTGVPAVVTSETQAIDAPRHSWKEWVKKRVVNRFASALVGGSAHVKYLESLGMDSGRIYTGYDVVDNDHFARGACEARQDAAGYRRRLGVPERYFLASCRFIPKKNLARLLHGYADYRLQAGADACHLVLLGDGPLRPDLEAIRRDLALQDWVSMPGFKPYHELPAYYGLAEAFVHASSTEQWGLVVNEAMAAGLPVIVSNRCGCAPDLVHAGHNGITFDPYDVSALTAALHRMAADTEVRTSMGAESRKLIANWTPEQFADGLEQAVEAAANALHARRRSLAERVLLWTLLQRRIERS